MVLDLANGVGQGATLDHATVQAHPDGRAVHAGVAMDPEGPGGGIVPDGKGPSTLGENPIKQAGKISAAWFIQEVFAGFARDSSLISTTVPRNESQVMLCK